MARTKTRALANWPNNAVSVLDYGAVGDGDPSKASANSAAFNAALSSGSKHVIVPAGNYCSSEIINIPNNCHLEGDNKGHGSYTGARITWTGSDSVCISFDPAYYSKVSNLDIWSDTLAANSSGINLNGNTRSNIIDVVVFGFGKGIVNKKQPTTFTHYFERVYVKNCTTGIDLSYFNNAVFTDCFIESCGTLVKLDVFTNAIFRGCVTEIFGDERLAETSTSKCFRISNGSNFVFRDGYVETGTQSSGALSTPGFIEATNIKGLTVDSNYFNRSSINLPPAVELLDSLSSSVSVTNNFFLRGPSAGVDYLVGARDPGNKECVLTYVVANNALKTTNTSGGGRLEEKDISYSPALYGGAIAPISGIQYLIDQGNVLFDGSSVTVNFNMTLSSKGGLGDSDAVFIKLPVAARPYLDAQNQWAAQISILNPTAPLNNLWASVRPGEDVVRIFNETTSVRGDSIASNTTFRGSVTYPIRPQSIE